MLIGERYRLLHLVGRGGMGRVWRARDELLHREVAVKQISLPEWAGDDERARLVARTMREAQAAARLSHPNVVAVHDVVHVDGAPWIVMEYVPSRSLQDVLDAGPLPPRRAAQVGLALLVALRAAHQAGVLHRDVKPGNVLLADDGRVMLTDFGLATFDDNQVALTRPGMVMGSPEYVAPERAREGVSSVGTDLWSLGATLYAAVEGRSPYARPTPMATLTALATTSPEPATRAGVLGPVLVGLLQRDPRRRLGSDAAQRLLRVAAGVEVPQSGDGQEYRLPPVHRKTSAPRPADLSHPPADLPAPLADLPAPLADLPGPLAASGPPGAVPAPATGGPATGSVLRQRWRWWVPVLAAVLAATVGMSTAMAVTWEQSSPPAIPPGVVDASRSTVVPPRQPPGYEPDGGHDGPLQPPHPPPLPFACVRPSHDGKLVAAAPQPPGERYRPPAGWTWYRDRSGFRIVVPVGWWRFQEQGVICFQDPRHGRALSIEPDIARPDDPLVLLHDAEQRALAQGDLIDYEPIRFTTDTHRWGGAWECRWTVPYGERMHTLQTVVGGRAGRAYRIGWTTGAAYWAAGRAQLATVLPSYRPPA